MFSADLHGNELQYRKLVDFAGSKKALSLIIGGDIAPKSTDSENYIKEQRSFLCERLPRILSLLKRKLPNCQIYLMMGNDDCACNLDILKRLDDSLFHVIHGRRLKLSGDIAIVGYSFVPITPFRLKDWEKFDLSEVPPHLTSEYANRKIKNHCLYGLKSTLKGWEQFQFSEAVERADSIQKDINKRVYTRNPEKTVYVFHTPPNRTNLDQRYYGDHVGSLAVRLFIEKYQPYVTLHGHIHETVDVSGDFMEIIGNSLSFSAGNHYLGDYVSILAFNLYDPKTAKRKVI